MPVMSVSPSTVVNIEPLALGASINTRSQMSLPLPALIRVEVATTPTWPCAPLVATELISLATAAALRGAGRGLRITGTLAATKLARSTGELAGGAEDRKSKRLNP